jgi:ferrous iron transport protein B
MKDIKISLVGQPNTGKSCLMNALAGAKAIVSNYPGTTIELIKAKARMEGSFVDIIDTPGIYSISDASAEEKVTEEVIFRSDIDGAVVVVDATAIERGLYLVIQIIEAGISTIVALNFIEEAEKKGIHIDSEKLGDILGVPVVPINPLTRRGIKELFAEILQIKEPTFVPFIVRYDDHIEKAINIISKELLESASISKRFVAIRILENDQDFFKYLENRKIPDDVASVLSLHPDVSRDISVTRYGEASFIGRLVTSILSKNKVRGFGNWLDELLLNPVIGPGVTLIFFSSVFAILLFIGGWFQEILMAGAEKYVVSLMPAHSSGLLVSMMKQGTYGLVAGVAIAFPYVFLFYIFLGLLEDIGLLSRFTLCLERPMRKLGLSGRAFIPAVLGLGCSVPAIRATRILPTEKEKMKVAFLFSTIPCSSRTAIIMGVVGFYGGILPALSVYATTVFSFLILAFLLRKTLKTVPQPLIMEMPSYRRPLFKNVLSKGWIRMRDFVFIVMPLLVAGGAFYGFLAESGFVTRIIEPFKPLTVGWLGLPPETIVPFVYGFIQKDLTAGMLVAVLGPDLGNFLSPLQLYTFGIVSSIQIPCIIAFWMLIRELKFNNAILITIVSLLYGLCIAGIIWRLITWMT